MVPSTVEHSLPATSLIQHWTARLWMKVFGWKVSGRAPVGYPRVVLIAYPHTSNWDFVHMIGAAWLFRYRLSWMGKHTLFKGLFGKFMVFMGGIAVDRRSPQGLVGQVADKINAADRIILAVPPSGTRKRSEHWKSGFYWIAHEAGVPIVPCFLDYGGRHLGMGEPFIPTGDFESDFPKLRAFYNGMTGKYPEDQTPLLTKSEHEASVI
jgi:1-acyl-sn-glycerol-3-phosphate acyltransferase